MIAVFAVQVGAILKTIAFTENDFALYLFFP